MQTMNRLAKDDGDHELEQWKVSEGGVKPVLWEDKSRCIESWSEVQPV